MATSPSQIPPAASRKRIKQMEVMVADTITETHDTTTVVLFTGNDKLEYRAGHFLTIDPHQFQELERFTAFLEDLKERKEPARAYSLTSAPHERHLAVTVKEERYVSKQTKYPPLLSPLLVRGALRGQRLVVTGFTGPYTLPDDIEERTDHILHACAGSGSVPNFSILKHALVHHPRLRHTFLYSNKSWDDVIFRKELDALERAHPERLELIYALTRERTHAGERRVREGRVDREMLRELLPDPTASFVYACGPAIGPWDRKAAKEAGIDPPPRFMETVLAALHELGVPKGHIRRESYG